MPTVRQILLTSSELLTLLTLLFNSSKGARIVGKKNSIVKIVAYNECLFITIIFWSLLFPSSSRCVKEIIFVNMVCARSKKFCLSSVIIKNNNV